jgi:hypothetical protein
MVAAEEEAKSVPLSVCKAVLIARIYMILSFGFP